MLLLALYLAVMDDELVVSRFVVPDADCAKSMWAGC
jgi:hypothetical protein